MYQDHPHFPPVSDSWFIWRYMDFTKFVATLEDNALWFPSCDKLDDPYEGAIPTLSWGVYKQQLKEVLGDVEQSNVLKQHKLTNEQARKATYASCWHKADHESAAMWKVYAPYGQGIAIHSNVNKLKQALKPATEAVYLGGVQYLDYSKTALSLGNFLFPFFCKRRSFEYEQEVRAIHLHPSMRQAEALPPGIRIAVDLDVLIDKVYVAPLSPDWVYQLVKKTLARHSLSHKDVIKSPLYDGPVS